MCSSAGLLVRDLIRDIWTKPTLVVAPRSPVRLCWNDPSCSFLGLSAPHPLVWGLARLPQPVSLGNRAGVRKAGER